MQKGFIPPKMSNSTREIVSITAIHKENKSKAVNPKEVILLLSVL
jgi:hypothetical protein